MRDRRRTPAGGVQAEKQRRYVQLIAQGVNNSEACRLVGINRKTGNRWRYGRKARNRAPDGRSRPHHAEHAARRRACRPRKRRIAGDEVLAEVVQRLLSKRWS